MKSLHVIPAFALAWHHGGPIYGVLGLTRELAREGHKVVVMTTNDRGPKPLDVPLECPVLMDGVEIWYFPLREPRWWYFSPSLGQALQHQVKKYDLVHVHSIFLWPTTVAASWCRTQRVPYIIRPADALDPTCIAHLALAIIVNADSAISARAATYCRSLGPGLASSNKRSVSVFLMVWRALSNKRG